MVDGSMRAMAYLGPQQVELRQIPIPHPQAGELLVRVKAAATCATDVKTYRRGHPKFPPPFIFGHEFAGEIVETGPDAGSFEIGQRVTANVFGECGACFYCHHGQGNLCENLEYNFGAFAEYEIIPASIVRNNTFVIPPHVTDAEATVLEPLVSVVHAHRLVNIRPGERVAILGAGGAISLMHLQLAVKAGAAEIFAIGHNDARLEVARQLGATAALNAHHQDPLAFIHERTGGYGVDVVIESAGSLSAWQMAVELVRRGGRVIWFGGLPGGTRVEIDATRLHYGEITLLNTHGGTAEDARCAFDLVVSGGIQARPLFSGELPLEQVELALQKMISGEAIKMIINPALPPS